MRLLCNNYFIINTQKYYPKDVMKLTGIYFKIKFMIESEAYLELCQKSNVESFAKIVNSIKKITIFKRNSVLEIFDRQDPEYVSANIFYNYIQRALSIAEHLNQ